MNQLATVDMSTGEIIDTAPALPDISHARLPETYKAARMALSECSRIDECQQWADKAEALASYARQAKDETLRRLADRIQARASRRCGELLKQIPPANGARTDLEPRKGTLTRSQAAEDAGLSLHQQRTAIRVANVPEEKFEQLVESDSPPTVTDLARLGTRPTGDAFGAGFLRGTAAPLEGLQAIRKFARFCGSTDAASLAASVVSPERKSELSALVGEIDSWLDQFITSL